jgi:hypothetical protein
MPPLCAKVTRLGELGLERLCPHEAQWFSSFFGTQPRAHFAWSLEVKLQHSTWFFVIKLQQRCKTIYQCDFFPEGPDTCFRSLKTTLWVRLCKHAWQVVHFGSLQGAGSLRTLTLGSHPHFLCQRDWLWCLQVL